MNKTLKFSKLVFFILVSVAAFVFASNCRGHHNFEKRMEWVSEKLTSKLDLDEAQQTKLQSIKTELVAKHKELKPKRDAWMTEVISQIRKDTVDVKSLEKVSAEQDVRHIEMRKFFQAKMIEFHAVLKPEQREKLAELVEKFSKKFNPAE
ncbi:MAG: Spy/CpxP family protein refolding chaperone [Leptospira sp.]|nr:Spy/CpxP family protein refolding chaperone [Leptospira sp.]